jgi:diguanylate cyclase (GGDEF)-like protein
MDDGVRTGEAVLEAVPARPTVAAFSCRLNRSIEWVDENWTAVTGLDAAVALERDLADAVRREDRAALEATFHRAAFAQSRASNEASSVRVRLASSERIVDVSLVAQRDARGVVGINGIMDDVTAVADAREMAASLALVFDRSPDLVGVTDDRGGVAYLNPAARARFGIATVEGCTVDQLYPPASFDVYYREMRPALLAKGWWRGVLTMYGRRGALLEIRQTVVAGIGPSGDTIEWLVSTGEDVTEARRAQADLAHRATHDALTGLANRALLLDHLEHALARAQRDDSTVGLVFADLDGFKAVNDAYGHATGDRVLVEVGRRFSAAVRPSDTVARFGGDEFVVLCEGIDDSSHEVDSIAARLRDALTARPLSLGATTVRLSTTTGTASSRGGATTAAHLLAAADRAMYDARRANRQPPTRGDAHRDAS